MNAKSPWRAQQYPNCRAPSSFAEAFPHPRSLAYQPSSHPPTAHLFLQLALQHSFPLPTLSFSGADGGLGQQSMNEAVRFRHMVSSVGPSAFGRQRRIPIVSGTPEDQ